MIDGDRDPISAGTAGEAVGRGGSRAETGMTAIPFGARQADSHKIGRVGYPVSGCLR